MLLIHKSFHFNTNKQAQQQQQQCFESTKAPPSCLQFTFAISYILAFSFSMHWNTIIAKTPTAQICRCTFLLVLILEWHYRRHRMVMSIYQIRDTERQKAHNMRSGRLTICILMTRTNSKYWLPYNRHVIYTGSQTRLLCIFCWDKTITESVLHIRRV